MERTFCVLLLFDSLASWRGSATASWDSLSRSLIDNFDNCLNTTDFSERLGGP